MYTSYFAQLKNLPKDIIPVSICGKVPSFYKGLQYKKLAPKYDFFMEWKHEHDNNYYVKCFNEQVLGNLNASYVFGDIYKMALQEQSNFKGIALICYEAKPPKDMTFEEIIKSDKYFCHRHIISNWFKENGLPCEEFYNDK